MGLLICICSFYFQLCCSLICARSRELLFRGRPWLNVYISHGQHALEQEFTSNPPQLLAPQQVPSAPNPISSVQQKRLRLCPEAIPDKTELDAVRPSYSRDPDWEDFHRHIQNPGTGDFLCCCCCYYYYYYDYFYDYFYDYYYYDDYCYWCYCSCCCYCSCSYFCLRLLLLIQLLLRLFCFLLLLWWWWW